MDVQIILPEKSLDQLGDGLVRLTGAIDAIDGEAVAHGFLGGENGYGAHWDNAAFTMRPFYWGDCDCGFEERSDAFWSCNKHSSDCYQSELRSRLADYDHTSGYAEIDRLAHEADAGPMPGMEERSENPAPGVFVSVFAPRNDAAMAAWRKAYDERRRFEDGLYLELCKKHGKTKAGCAVHCTCGLAEKARAYFQEQGHRATCALELPNFRHKASGFEVRWYKYIGRGMETLGSPPDIEGMIAECVSSLDDGSSRAATKSDA